MPKATLPVLVQEPERASQELTQAAKADIKTLDEVFGMLKELCPELLQVAIDTNHLGDLTKLVEFVRGEMNDSALAAHCLQHADREAQGYALKATRLEDLVRRVGMNLDAEHMKSFKGEPGELIECHLPPTVALALYQMAYPLIVSQGVLELKGEVPHPETLNNDRFWGRPPRPMPGEVYAVGNDGVMKKIGEAHPSGPSDQKRLEIAIRQEVVRQGHEVQHLRLSPTDDGRFVHVDLRVKDQTRPFDNAVLKSVIDRETSVYARPDLRSVHALFQQGMISCDEFKRLAQLPDLALAGEVGRSMANTYVEEQERQRLQDLKTAQAQALSDAKDKGEDHRGVSMVQFPQVLKY